MASAAKRKILPHGNSKTETNKSNEMQLEVPDYLERYHRALQRITSKHKQQPDLAIKVARYTWRSIMVYWRKYRDISEIFVENIKKKWLLHLHNINLGIYKSAARYPLSIDFDNVLVIFVDLGIRYLKDVNETLSSVMSIYYDIAECNSSVKSVDAEYYSTVATMFLLERVTNHYRYVHENHQQYQQINKIIELLASRVGIDFSPLIDELQCQLVMDIQPQKNQQLKKLLEAKETLKNWYIENFETALDDDCILVDPQSDADYNIKDEIIVVKDERQTVPNSTDDQSVQIVCCTRTASNGATNGTYTNRVHSTKQQTCNTTTKTNKKTAGAAISAKTANNAPKSAPRGGGLSSGSFQQRAPPSDRRSVSKWPKTHPSWSDDDQVIVILDVEDENNMGSSARRKRKKTEDVVIILDEDGDDDKGQVSVQDGRQVDGSKSKTDILNNNEVGKTAKSLVETKTDVLESGSKTAVAVSSLEAVNEETKTVESIVKIGFAHEASDVKKTATHLVSSESGTKVGITGEAAAIVDKNEIRQAVTTAATTCAKSFTEIETNKDHIPKETTEEIEMQKEPPGLSKTLQTDQEVIDAVADAEIHNHSPKVIVETGYVNETDGQKAECIPEPEESAKAAESKITDDENKKECNVNSVETDCKKEMVTGKNAQESGSEMIVDLEKETTDADSMECAEETNAASNKSDAGAGSVAFLEKPCVTSSGIENSVVKEGMRTREELISPVCSESAAKIGVACENAEIVNEDEEKPQKVTNAQAATDTDISSAESVVETGISREPPEMDDSKGTTDEVNAQKESASKNCAELLVENAVVGETNQEIIKEVADNNSSGAGSVSEARIDGSKLDIKTADPKITDDKEEEKEQAEKTTCLDSVAETSSKTDGSKIIMNLETEYNGAGSVEITEEANAASNKLHAGADSAEFLEKTCDISSAVKNNVVKGGMYIEEELISSVSSEFAVEMDEASAENIKITTETFEGEMKIPKNMDDAFDSEASKTETEPQCLPNIVCSPIVMTVIEQKNSNFEETVENATSAALEDKGSKEITKNDALSDQDVPEQNSQQQSLNPASSQTIEVAERELQMLLDTCAKKNANTQPEQQVDASVITKNVNCPQNSTEHWKKKFTNFLKHNLLAASNIKECSSIKENLIQDLCNPTQQKQECSPVEIKEFEVVVTKGADCVEVLANDEGIVDSREEKEDIQNGVEVQNIQTVFHGDIEKLDGLQTELNISILQPMDVGITELVIEGAVNKKTQLVQEDFHEKLKEKVTDLSISNTELNKANQILKKGTEIEEKKVDINLSSEDSSVGVSKNEDSNTELRKGNQITKGSDIEENKQNKQLKNENSSIEALKNEESYTELKKANQTLATKGNIEEKKVDKKMSSEDSLIRILKKEDTKVELKKMNQATKDSDILEKKKANKQLNNKDSSFEAPKNEDLNTEVKKVNQTNVIKGNIEEKKKTRKQFNLELDSVDYSSIDILKNEDSNTELKKVNQPLATKHIDVEEKKKNELNEKLTDKNKTNEKVVVDKILGKEKEKVTHDTSDGEKKKPSKRDTADNFSSERQKRREKLSDEDTGKEKKKRNEEVSDSEKNKHIKNLTSEASGNEKRKLLDDDKKKLNKKEESAGDSGYERKRRSNGKSIDKISLEEQNKLKEGEKKKLSDEESSNKRKTHGSSHAEKIKNDANEHSASEERKRKDKFKKKPSGKSTDDDSGNEKLNKKLTNNISGYERKERRSESSGNEKRKHNEMLAGEILDSGRTKLKDSCGEKRKFNEKETSESRRKRRKGISTDDSSDSDKSRWYKKQTDTDRKKKGRYSKQDAKLDTVFGGKKTNVNEHSIDDDLSDISDDDFVYDEAEQKTENNEKTNNSAKSMPHLSNNIQESILSDWKEESFGRKDVAEEHPKTSRSPRTKGREKGKEKSPKIEQVQQKNTGVIKYNDKQMIEGFNNFNNYPNEQSGITHLKNNLIKMQPCAVPNEKNFTNAHFVDDYYNTDNLHLIAFVSDKIKSHEELRKHNDDDSSSDQLFVDENPEQDVTHPDKPKTDHSIDKILKSPVFDQKPVDLSQSSTNSDTTANQSVRTAAQKKVYEPMEEEAIKQETEGKKQKRKSSSNCHRNLSMVCSDEEPVQEKKRNKRNANKKTAPEIAVEPPEITFKSKGVSVVKKALEKELDNQVKSQSSTKVNTEYKTNQAVNSHTQNWNSSNEYKSENRTLPTQIEKQMSNKETSSDKSSKSSRKRKSFQENAEIEAKSKPTDSNLIVNSTNYSKAAQKSSIIKTDNGLSASEYIKEKSLQQKRKEEPDLFSILPTVLSNVYNNVPLLHEPVHMPYGAEAVENKNVIVQYINEPSMYDLDKNKKSYKERKEFLSEFFPQKTPGVVNDITKTLVPPNSLEMYTQYSENNLTEAAPILEPIINPNVIKAPLANIPMKPDLELANSISNIPLPEDCYPNKIVDTTVAPPQISVPTYTDNPLQVPVTLSEFSAVMAPTNADDLQGKVQDYVNIENIPVTSIYADFPVTTIATDTRNIQTITQNDFVTAGTIARFVPADGETRIQAEAQNEFVEFVSVDDETPVTDIIKIVGGSTIVGTQTNGTAGGPMFNDGKNVQTSVNNETQTATEEPPHEDPDTDNPFSFFDNLMSESIVEAVAGMVEDGLPEEPKSENTLPEESENPLLEEPKPEKDSYVGKPFKTGDSCAVLSSQETAKFAVSSPAEILDLINRGSDEMEQASQSEMGGVNLNPEKGEHPKSTTSSRSRATNPEGKRKAKKDASKTIIPDDSCAVLSSHERAKFAVSSPDEILDLINRGSDEMEHTSQSKMGGANLSPEKREHPKSNTNSRSKATNPEEKGKPKKDASETIIPDDSCADAIEKIVQISKQNNSRHSDSCGLKTGVLEGDNKSGVGVGVSTNHGLQKDKPNSAVQTTYVGGSGLKQNVLDREGKSGVGLRVPANHGLPKDKPNPAVLTAYLSDSGLKPSVLDREGKSGVGLRVPANHGLPKDKSNPAVETTYAGGSGLKQNVLDREGKSGVGLIAPANHGLPKDKPTPAVLTAYLSNSVLKPSVLDREGKSGVGLRVPANHGLPKDKPRPVAQRVSGNQGTNEQNKHHSRSHHMHQQQQILYPAPGHPLKHQSRSRGNNHTRPEYRHGNPGNEQRSSSSRSNNKPRSSKTKGQDRHSQFAPQEPNKGKTKNNQTKDWRNQIPDDLIKMPNVY